MVQYKTYPPPHTVWYNRYNTHKLTPFESSHEGRVFNSTKYWQLVDRSSSSKQDLQAELLNRGISTDNLRAASRSNDRLVQLVSRAERGLLTYTGTPPVELRRYIVDRKIALGRDVSRWGRLKMIALLEKADEDPSFPRFEELPPELRSMIYSFHLQELETHSAELPVTPPVTRVSRLLRKESLPLFYNICNISLQKSMFFGSIKPFTPSAQRHLARFRNFKACFYTACNNGDNDPETSFTTFLELSISRGIIKCRIACYDPLLFDIFYRTWNQIQVSTYVPVENFGVELVARHAARMHSIESAESQDYGLNLQEKDFQTLRLLFRDV